MTTLYKPVLIESAEQAEALGWKTPIHIVLARTQEVHDVQLFEDFAEDFWPDALEPGNRWVYVALVSIEAEEEATTHFCTPGCREGDYCAGPMSRNTRLVTPWEEV